MTDKVKITIKAGDGGDGAVSFHREKFVTRGGPDGGDGGRGGSVYLVADTNVSTLDDFKSKKVFSAQNGQPGRKLRMAGRDGEDNIIKVPLGTLVFLTDGDGSRGQRMLEHNDDATKEDQRQLIADLSTLGEPFLLAKGGRGGKGNYKFKSSTNQTPTQYIPGEPGEQREVVLELKLIADVGLIGLPSAGKSTLINTLTHINAKTAEYHFTTLEPNLGVWQVDRAKKVVVADIPGLIEGASKGKGLGDDFLRHIERTKVLIHLVEPFAGDGGFAVEPKAVFRNYQVIQQELLDYKSGLLDISTKPQIVVINKCDITEVKDRMFEIADYFMGQGVEVFPISAATGEGTEILRKKVLELLANAPEPQLAIEPVVKKYTVYNLPGVNRRPVMTKDVKGLMEAPKRRTHAERKEEINKGSKSDANSR